LRKDLKKEDNKDGKDTLAEWFFEKLDELQGMDQSQDSGDDEEVTPEVAFSLSMDKIRSTSI
jgi:hypothetical protein